MAGSRGGIGVPPRYGQEQNMPMSSRLSNEMLWVMVGTFVSMAVALAGTRFLTTYLSPAEYGRLALMISVAVLFDQVAGHAIGGAAMRFYPIYRSKGRLRDLRDIVLNSWRISAVVCIFAAILVSYVRWPMVEVLFLLTAGFALALLISGVGVRLAEGARQRRNAAVFRSVFEVMRFGLAVLLVFHGSATAEFAMGGFLAGAAIVAGLHWFYARFRLLRENTSDNGRRQLGNLTKSFRTYAMPLLVVGLGTWVFLMSPLWALGWFGKIADAGIFSAYHQLAFVPMLVISGLLLTFAAPIVYEKMLDSVETAMKGTLRLAGITLIVVIVAAVLAYFGHHLIAILLLGESFRDYSWMFPWLILAGGMYGVAQQLLLRLRAEMKTARLAVFQLGFAAAATVIYTFAVKLFSIDGVVYTVAALNAVLLILAAGLVGVLVKPTRIV
jgi:O-antigen/teichoic acid export membrane protein